MGKSDEDLELERIDAESSIPDLYGCVGWTLLAIVAWVFVFVSVVGLGVVLSPFDSVCNPPGTSLTDDLNCRGWWTVGFLLLGAGLALGAVASLVVWIRHRQSSGTAYPPHA